MVGKGTSRHGDRRGRFITVDICSDELVIVDTCESRDYRDELVIVDTCESRDYQILLQELGNGKPLPNEARPKYLWNKPTTSNLMLMVVEGPNTAGFSGIYTNLR
eukprot:6185009-Pleurochrysis_carterae.AAC.3